MLVDFAPQSKLSFHETGTENNSALLFLHAFPLDKSMWDEQLAHFACDFRCLAPDFPGFNESEPFSDFSSALADYAPRLQTFLTEREIEKAVIIGLSMGGYAAFEMWRQFPERVSGLVLCDTRADADNEDAKKSRDEMIEFARDREALEVLQKMLPKLVGANTRHHNPSLLDDLADIAIFHNSVFLADTILALKNRRDSSDLLPQITVPTLVLGGEEDEISSPQIMGEMAAKIRNSRYVVIEGAGHLSNLEQPEKFNAALREWLEAL